MLSRLTTVVGLGTAMLVAAAAPAGAAVVQSCSGKGICYVTSPVTIAPGTVTLGPLGAERQAVAGPRLCDTGGGGCIETALLLPGAWVSTSGRTLLSVTVPSFGVDLANGAPTVYYGVPGVDADGTLDGAVTATVQVPLVPVVTGETLCPNALPDDLQTVTFEGCYAVVAVEVL